MKAMFGTLWRYRAFVMGSVKREFQNKYRNSMLGAAWVVLNPLAMILVYTLVLAGIMHARLSGATGRFAYSVYLCAGVLPWGLFTELSGRMQNVFIDNANLIKKLSFPRLCLPIIVTLSSLINFAIIFGLFLAFLLVSGHFPGFAFFGMFPLLAIELLFSIGLGVVIGVLNVFFRDVGQFYGIVLQFWFWLTPIVYVSNILPASMKRFELLNPMAVLIEGYQQVFLRSVWPSWAHLWPIAAFSLALCALGLYLFRRHVGEMVDEL
ncbi:ABC transporter permease [Dyella sp. A6]|uniref:ABC transporter permease n=1 Tax=Dyella aluminiiresistens TaxID=3069105 RepID=UPI002E786937|nr:ABC transporter permease [Dyella sp. A6]